MFSPVYTKQFAKDIKRQKRRGKNMVKFRLIAQTILAGEPLDVIHREYRLIGNYAGRRECHIESDWLLIYKTGETRVIFERMGTHADLFKK